MYISKSKFKTKSGKIYQSTLLRQSYRENGKVKKRTIANLSKCSKEELQAIELALANKKDLSNLSSFSESVKTKEGLSVGAIYVLYEVARKIGIVNALGNDHNGKLALWQIFARILEQGSRLSSVRLAETYALTSLIKIEKEFTEDDLYKNLNWLAQNQEKIEDKLFELQKQNSTLFLYDVTSSYLEGTKNELADWGYNRDGKKGKKQIVIGMLCNNKGVAISTEVFKGNTNDTATFLSQIEKAKARFKCNEVTFVGDRGMIKSGQIEDLSKHGFYYITAITKKQIETLKKNNIQLEFFDNKICEIEEGSIRYILKKNPTRAKEIEETRESKKSSILKLIQEQNAYLLEHPKAKELKALERVQAKITRLNTNKWLSVKITNRSLELIIDEAKLEEESMLDGCYVIKTNLTKEKANAQIVHDRYKDLAFVETAFRTCKSNLDLRPIFVRSEMSTYGHVIVVMLSYMIMKELNDKWKELYLTVEEGIKSLSTLTLQEITLKDKYTYQQIPEPRKQNKKMLDVLKIELPKILPKNEIVVSTRKNRRKSALKN